MDRFLFCPKGICLYFGCEALSDPLYSARNNRWKKGVKYEHCAKSMKRCALFDGFCLTKSEKSITLYSYVSVEMETFH